MKLAGRIIINLMLIYLIGFFCQNCLIVKCSLRVKIGFLPSGCNLPEDKRTFNKGRFEFINLFFQFGMFIAKTVINVVKKIKPIEVITSCILIVTILAVLQYNLDFAAWYIFIPVMLLLGFAIGSSYGNGFFVYTIILIF